MENLKRGERGTFAKAIMDPYEENGPWSGPDTHRHTWDTCHVHTAAGEHYCCKTFGAKQSEEKIISSNVNWKLTF